MSPFCPSMITSSLLSLSLSVSETRYLASFLYKTPPSSGGIIIVPRKKEKKMPVFVRTKRVTDPLDDRVKACICGTGGGSRSGSVASGSGSEHEADSCFLDDLANGFLEESGAGDCGDCGGGGDAARNSSVCSDDEDSGPGGRSDPVELLKAVMGKQGSGDRFRRRLCADVERATEACSSLQGKNKEAFTRAAMRFLRELGHNAGLCKTKWATSGGLTGGNYEFIDVVRRSEREGGAGVRYLVDLDFAAEFEIARPTEEYSRVVRVLPGLFVGRSEELKQIVRVASEAAKRSLKKRGMHLPPWRKNRYMQAKWLGPYRRTLNPIGGSLPHTASLPAVRCRSVGFFSGPEPPVGTTRHFVV